jgi:hypothetical protein
MTTEPRDGETTPSWWCWGCGAPKPSPAPGIPCGWCSHSTTANFDRFAALT